MWSLHWLGGRRFVWRVVVTWPRWLSRPYMVKTFKNLLLWNQRANVLGAWYAASGTWAQQSLLKWWPWFDLDLLFLRQGQICFLLLLYGKISISSGKMLESRLMEDTYNKGPKWPDVSVEIKILSDGLKRYFLNLQQMTKVMRPFC